MNRVTRLMAILITVVATVVGPASDVEASTSTSGHSPRSETTASIPILAYYYIWYSPSTWRRAKTDYPLIGTYTSDETAVMRRHMAMAKSAGIDGFLVSWKDTSVLTPRLERLVEVAREERFSLGIVYQGLDFERNPLPIEKVRHDLELFADRYATDPVFDIFGPPIVIWTGTAKFSREEIAAAVAPVAGRVSVLASASSIDDYERVADLVQGDAHYWSSVDPEKEWYPARMRALGTAVHAHDGLWIAPAAPGFDARLIGGTSVIPRRGTETLATELAVAAESGADGIGLISWNEYSENSHVEPSEVYGNAALREVARFSGADPQSVLAVDSSEPAQGHAGLTGWAAVLVTGLIVVVTALVARRKRTDAGAPPTSGEGFGW